MSRAPTVALLACAATGCLRDVTPELGADRTVDVGVPLSWGKPDGSEVDWDFGDGAHARGAAVRHTFVTPGRYAVQTLRNGVTLAHVMLEAIPRPVVHAIPEAADGALFLPRVNGRLEGVVDFAEKIVGPDSMQRFLDASVLASVALESRAVQGEAGIGLFTLPGFKGLIGLVAVQNPAAVVRVIEQRFARMGAGFAQAADGTFRIGGPSGETLALLVDRGYVFLIVPQPAASVGSTADPAVAIQAIRMASNDGIEKAVAPLDGLANTTGELLLRITTPHQTEVRTLLVAATLSGTTLSVDGKLLASGPLWDVQKSPRSPLLKAAPDGFVAALSLSISPGDMAPVVTSLLAAPERAAALMRWGFSMEDVDALTRTLAGDAAFLAYFDPAGFFAHLAEADARPEPRGALLGRAGLTQPAVLERLLHSRLAESGAVARGGASYQLPFDGLPGGVRLHVSGDVLEVRAGEGPLSQHTLDVPAVFGERHGAGAFADGHVSLFLDMGQLLHQLEQPLSVPGLSGARLSILQGFSAEFARRLTPIDQIFVDVVPDASGARVRGTLTLRPR
jgi:hypothetical protein